MARTQKVIKFSSDTKHRKQWFTGISFSHPAKMSLPLQLWIIDNFTKEGETILDPMAGSGTILVACSMGRNVITVELEDKFVQMQKDNWEKIRQRGCQLGYSMGTATILQGDARNLEGLLVDKCVFSPPFANAQATTDDEYILKHTIGGKLATHHVSAENIGNLPYGEIDKIVTSPPYAEAQSGGGIAQRGYQGSKHSPTDLVGKRGYMPEQAGQADGQISALPYGSIDAVISSPPHGNRLSDGAVDDKDPQRMSYRQALKKVDAVISSPPYEDSLSEPEDRKHSIDQSKWKDGRKIAPPHSQVHLTYPSSSEGNIGNLKSDSYLSAMLLVYQNCFAVLKDGGLMILVTKNFIRNKAQVRLDQDTIKLCEQAGFTFQDRWYRELASQSFWRTIYHQKYPDVEPIKYEDILIFIKG